MIDAPLYSLSEVTEQFLLRKGIDRLKYFGRYFSIAGDVYRKLYRTVMPTIISKYVPVIDDESEPFPYVEAPSKMQRFFGISITDNCGELKEVFYNNDLNVFTKPHVTKPCGCQTTDLCDCIDNLSVVITEKIIDGVTYYTKVWQTCCDNGTVLQYTEVPVKDYDQNNGSYSDDYGDDYDIINEGNNVTILRFTKNLGRLDTKVCGCPLDTENNREIIYKKCGACMPLKAPCCRKWYNDNIHCFGEMKFSECNTKIYLKNVKTDNGFAVISYQANPIDCGQEVFIEEYARMAIWTGIEHESTIFNPKSTLSDKQFAKNNRRSAEYDLFEYLNPLNRDRFFNCVTAEIKM